MSKYTVLCRLWRWCAI